MRSVVTHIFLTCFFLAALMLQSTAIYAADIKNIRFGKPNPSTSRLVIETSEDTDFKVFFLNNPKRLVLDIPHASWSATAFQAQRNIPIIGYRYGSPHGNTGRIVFDLAKTQTIDSAFFLPRKQYKKADRIVIDLKQNSAAGFKNSLKTAWERYRHIGKTANKTRLEHPITIAAANDTKPVAAAPVKPAHSRRIIPKRERIKRLMTAFQNRGIASLISSAEATLPTPAPEDILKPPASTPNVTPQYTGLPPGYPRPSRKPKTAFGIKVIALDAGHGGRDPGAVNGKILEKHITLSLSRELKTKLEATGRYKVIMTRKSDKSLKLRERVKIARKAKADLFISIHADKIDKKSLRGTSVYTLSEKASDKETAKLAKNENNAGLIAGIDLSDEEPEVVDILIDLAMRDTMNHSNILANTLVDHLRKDGIKLINRAHRSAGFAVLKAPDTPSILIEAGFISNRQEAMQLRTKTYQRKMAQSIVSGVDHFFRKLELTALH